MSDLWGREWVEEALCREVDMDLFFPERGELDVARMAKQVCAGCPVKAECLAEALALDDRYGVRGGLTERERRRLVGPRPNPALRSRVVS